MGRANLAVEADDAMDIVHLTRMPMSMSLEEEKMNYESDDSVKMD